MPYIELGDERIYYSYGKSERDRNLLLIHGAGGDHLTWPWGLRRMPDANVYAIDLPGHGKSSGTGRQSIDAYADFIEAFASELELGNVTAFGHSMGGGIVQTLAVRSPGWMKRAVLVGTGAKLRVRRDIVDGMLSDFESAVNIVCEMAFGPAASELIVTAGRKALLNSNPNIIRNDYLACDRFDVMEAIKGISIPVLVVSGTVDRLTPVKYGEYLKNAIPGSEMLVLEGCGHMMMLEKPERFIQGVIPFLD